MITSTIQYSSVIARLTCGLYDQDRERSPTKDSEWTPSTRRDQQSRSRQGYMTERQWELYRLSVVERMPESDYKTAVLAGIAHRLKMLDRLEASHFAFIEDAARTRTGRSRGLARAATARDGWNGSS